MSYRVRAWLMIAAVVPLCVGAIWLVSRYRAGTIDSHAKLLARLPSRDAVILCIDFAGLRKAGLLQLLANAKVPEDPEYRQFVSKTEFDYAQDLDLALASFAPGGTYMLLRGRFAWSKLYSYAAQHGGDCYNTFCRMVGSTPDRKISFFPVRPELMGLAVSTDPDAAIRLQATVPEARLAEIPTDPVWVSLPASTLRNMEKLPAGTRMFAQSMADAEEITLSLGPQGGSLEARLRARCRSEHDAAALAGQLGKITALLRSMIARENRTPNARDLSGVLTNGSFSHTDRQVFGRWPVAQAFLEETLSGESR